MNLPAAFVERMHAQLGKEAEEFLASLQQPAIISVRTNPFKTSVISGEKIPWCNTGFYLAERPSFTFDPLFHAGTYYVQEASSMFIEQVFKQQIVTTEPLVVLDLCAAPGGKSTHLASLLNEKSLLVANEVIKSRSYILAENIIKWGSGNVIVTNNDPRDFSSYENLFDIILIDAPCSGEGLFRKDAGALDEWSPENAHLCSVRQKRILNDVIHALKPGGLLIYSTCTYNPEENEQNVELLCRDQSLECLPLKLDANWGVEEKYSGKCISYHFYPGKVKGEGLFLSVLKKKEDGSEFEAGEAKQKFFSPLKKEFSSVESWINLSEEKKLFEKNDVIQLLPARHINLIESFYKNLRVMYAGVEIGTIKNKEVIPAHALAMYSQLNKKIFDSVTMSREEALKYLRRDELLLPAEKTGWKLVTFNEVPLGWIKHLGRRMNNYYPVEWRIRKMLS